MNSQEIVSFNNQMNSQEIDILQTRINKCCGLTFDEEAKKSIRILVKSLSKKECKFLYYRLLSLETKNDFEKYAMSRLRYMM